MSGVIFISINIIIMLFKESTMEIKTRLGAIVISAFLTLAASVSVWPIQVNAEEPSEKLSDETYRKSNEITLSDGTSTGVSWTEITVNSESTEGCGSCGSSISTGVLAIVTSFVTVFALNAKKKKH